MVQPAAGSTLSKLPPPLQVEGGTTLGSVPPRSLHVEHVTPHIEKLRYYDLVANVEKLLQHAVSLESVTALQEDGLRLRDEACAALSLEIETAWKVGQDQVEDLQSELKAYKSLAAQCMLKCEDESYQARVVKDECDLLVETSRKLEEYKSELKEDISQQSAWAVQSRSAWEHDTKSMQAEIKEAKLNVTEWVVRIDRLKTQLMQTKDMLKQSKALARNEAKARTQQRSMEDVVASTRSLRLELETEKANVKRLKEMIDLEYQAIEKAVKLKEPSIEVEDGTASVTASHRFRIRSQGLSKPRVMSKPSPLGPTLSKRLGRPVIADTSDKDARGGSSSHVVAELKRRVSLLVPGSNEAQPLPEGQDVHKTQGGRSTRAKLGKNRTFGDQLDLSGVDSPKGRETPRAEYSGSPHEAQFAP